MTTELVVIHGAGDGNRTHVISLEGWSSTIELHPHEHLRAANLKNLPRHNTTRKWDCLYAILKNRNAERKLRSQADIIAGNIISVFEFKPVIACLGHYDNLHAGCKSSDLLVFRIRTFADL